VDVLRSVSRSLPQAASAHENALIARARALLGAYAESELMIRAGLYAPGSDARLDEAVRIFPGLDISLPKSPNARQSFAEALGPVSARPGYAATPLMSFAPET
jgi:flagellum-specific ATP synthase